MTDGHTTTLESAENHLIQALIREFMLVRDQDRCTLKIRIDRKTEAIRRRESKTAVQEQIVCSRSRRKEIKDGIEKVLIHGTEADYTFSDDAFFFRYVSGGALPILEIGKEKYFCLFFRDVDPVGWNIANGGADSIQELINPATTISRELREELIVLNEKRKLDYSFSDTTYRGYELPEYDLARMLWSEYYQDKDLRSYTRTTLDEEHIKWEYGPDCVEVTYENRDPRLTDNCYIVITTEDCGIEIDRVVSMRFDNMPLLLDGELIDGKLLNRPIGLFNTKRISLKQLQNKSNQCFIPDKVVSAGQPIYAKFTSDSKSILKKHVGRFVQALIERKLRGSEHSLEDHETNDTLFNLCPVTRTLLIRYLKRKEAGSVNELVMRNKVFVSYKWEDGARNRWVHKFGQDLAQDNHLNVQLDEYEIGLGESITHYMTSRIGRECRAFLFIITPASVAAVEQGTGNLSFEMQLATARRIADPDFKMIGVFREGSGNTPYLEGLKYIDFRDDNNYDKKIAELVEYLVGL